MQVVRDVYWMVCGVGELDFGNVAKGLHEPIQGLRAMTVGEDGIHLEFRSDLLMWASYIHLGA